MEQRMGSIYLAKNLITGKLYVGQTRLQIPQFRITAHKNDKGNTRFHNAIRKYGIDNFIFCWLHYKDLSEKKLNQYERYYIWLYDTQNRNKGYNITSGGDFSPMHDEETRIKHAKLMG